MSKRVESRHANGTSVQFTTDEPLSKVIADLTKRNGEIVSLHWEPITYKGKEINV